MITEYIDLAAAIVIPIAIFVAQWRLDKKAGEVFKSQKELLTKIDNTFDEVSILVEKIKDQTDVFNVIISNIDNNVAMQNISNTIQIEMYIEKRSEKMMFIPEELTQISARSAQVANLKRIVDLIDRDSFYGNLVGYRRIPYVPLPGHRTWAEKTECPDDEPLHVYFEELGEENYDKIAYFAYAEGLKDRFDVNVPDLLKDDRYLHEYYGIKEYIEFGIQEKFEIPWELIGAAFCSNQIGIMTCDFRYFFKLFKKFPELIVAILSSIQLADSHNEEREIDFHHFILIQSCVYATYEALGMTPDSPYDPKHIFPSRELSKRIRYSLMKCVQEMVDKEFFFLSKKRDGDSKTLSRHIIFLLAVLSDKDLLVQLYMRDLIYSYFEEWKAGNRRYIHSPGPIDHSKNAVAWARDIFKSKGMHREAKVVEEFIQSQLNRED